MPRIVRDQVIASTSLDSHGERLPEGVLMSYFHQMRDGDVGASLHDLTQAPTFRSFNKRLVRTSDGDLAITVDLEILDEERYSPFGGFSIAFTGRRQQFGVAPFYPRITVNTRQFDFDQTAKVLAEQLPRTPFEVVERVEKAEFVTLAVIGIAVGGYIVTRVTAAAISNVFSGFFEEAGKDLYQAVKGVARSDQPNGPVEIQFHLHVHEPPRRPVIILRVDPRCSERDIAAVSREQMESILSGVEVDRFDRVTAELLPGGQLKLIATVSVSGEVSSVVPASKTKKAKRKRRRKRKGNA